MIITRTIKAGTLPRQEKDFLSGFNRGYKAVHPEFPEELAYKFVMSAYKHARQPVVTASVDRLDFLAPAKKGDILILKSS